MIARNIFFGMLLIATACESSLDARKQLGKETYDRLLVDLAPYVVKKPDALTYENRFEVAARPFYKNFLDLSHARLSYHQQKDTARFFSFVYQDLASLREHYRVLGGYYKLDENDSIVFVNLLYHTPRFTAEVLGQKDKMLFESMITKGNVDRFIGNKDFIDTPDKDFYYNFKLNRWDYTENSSWKFLDSASQEVVRDPIF